MINARHQSRFRVFGQACLLVVNSDDNPAPEVLALAEQEFRRIESKFDSVKPDSVIALINQRAGTGCFTELDAESRSLLDYVQILWEESNHLFDPTTCLLQSVFGEGGVGIHKRPRGSLNLSQVGWTKLEISNQGAHLREPGMLIDLNKCVRPYAVDCVRKLFIKSGVKNALIDMGCDIATIGKQADGANWLVGVRYPAGPRTAIEQFKLNNSGYAIRGDFERSLLINDERFSRLLSPIDGQPILGLLGLAVIADNCLAACSAVSIAGLKTEKNALKWLENIGLPWLAIDRQLHCHGPLLSKVPSIC